MLEALLSTLTLSGAVSAAVAARWAVVRRRRLAREREILALVEEIPVGNIGHLSPRLAELAAQARVVRLLLATPLCRYHPPVLRETPWGRRSRCDQYDLALSDARRALWDWLLLFRSLGERDRYVLGGLGVSLTPFYSALFETVVSNRSADPWEKSCIPRPRTSTSCSRSCGGPCMTCAASRSLCSARCMILIVGRVYRYGSDGVVRADAGPASVAQLGAVRRPAGQGRGGRPGGAGARECGEN